MSEQFRSQSTKLPLEPSENLRALCVPKAVVGKRKGHSTIANRAISKPVVQKYLIDVHTDYLAVKS